MADYPSPPVQSEREFLYGESPHPAVVDHTAAVVERVQALTPPSLVRMDRAEALVAEVVAWRRLELGGQGLDDHQWWDALNFIRDLADRYIEATS